MNRFVTTENVFLLCLGVGKKVVLPLMVKLHQFQTLTEGMGDSELRRLLYMGALGGVRGNNPLKPFYQRLVDRGKAKKVALVAASRKILVWAWTIFSPANSMEFRFPSNWGLTITRESWARASRRAQLFIPRGATLIACAWVSSRKIESTSCFCTVPK